MPEPKKKQREPLKQYRSRLIAHYIREGYPRDQAAAIAYRKTRTSRVDRRKTKRKRRVRR